MGRDFMTRLLNVFNWQSQSSGFQTIGTVIPLAVAAHTKGNRPKSYDYSCEQSRANYGLRATDSPQGFLRLARHSLVKKKHHLLTCVLPFYR